MAKVSYLQFKCEHCEKVFSSRKEVISHIQQQHKNITISISWDDTLKAVFPSIDIRDEDVGLIDDLFLVAPALHPLRNSAFQSGVFAHNAIRHPHLGGKTAMQVLVESLIALLAGAAKKDFDVKMRLLDLFTNHQAALFHKRNSPFNSTADLVGQLNETKTLALYDVTDEECMALLGLADTAPFNETGHELGLDLTSEKWQSVLDVIGKCYTSLMSRWIMNQDEIEAGTAMLNRKIRKQYPDWPALQEIVVPLLECVQLGQNRSPVYAVHDNPAARPFYLKIGLNMETQEWLKTRRLHPDAQTPHFFNTTALPEQETSVINQRIAEIDQQQYNINQCLSAISRHDIAAEIQQELIQGVDLHIWTC